MAATPAPAAANKNAGGNADGKHFDLIVIGGGPGGYVGAIRAAQLGMKVACVERDRLGGVCLNWGCIPTKALLKNAALYTEVSRHGEEFGLTFDRLSFNWEKVIGRSRNIADQLNKGVHFLFKKNKIAHFEAHAKITRAKSADLPCEVKLFDQPGGAVKDTITADRVLIATGAQPRDLPFAHFDGETIMSSKEAMILKERPDSLIVIGAGAIGVEFAYFYNAFGTEVTIIEMLDHLVPAEDEEISKVLEREFKKSGVKFKTRHIVKAIEVIDRGGGKKGVKVSTAKVGDNSKTEEMEADKVLLAIGVKGRYDGLFDDSLGIETFKDHIRTDYLESNRPTYRTNLSGIYAIGDVIGPPWLAHVASEEAIVCVERMMNHETPGVDYDSIPGCTYCHPQIASIGRTERALQEAGLVKDKDYGVGIYQLKSHGRALAVGGAVGMVKLLRGMPYGEILGAHIIGEEATELIAEFALGKSVEATVEDIINTMHAHPTMHEAIHEAALASEGRVIHQ